MAARFWVGGTGTWDNSATTNWATSSGGVGGAAAPTSVDAVTFDGNSGASAVITMGANVAANSVVLGVTGGAFTGTLDGAGFSPTFGFFAFSGAGTRTLTMGSGTWTLIGNSGGNVWDFTTTTGLTFNTNTSVISIAPSGTTSGSRVFVGGAKTFNSVSVVGPTAFTGDAPLTFTGSNTFTSLNIVGPSWVRITSGTTQTVTNAFTWAGTSSSPIMFDGGTGSSGTISSAATSTMAWTALTGVLFSGGGTFTATNSLNLGGNTGITITAPVVGGGGGVVIGS